MAPLDPKQAADLLHNLRMDARLVLPWGSATSPDFTSWHHRARTVLIASLGKSHNLTQAFLNLRWTPSAWVAGSADAAFHQAFIATHDPAPTPS
jgi:hypothetical protein